MIVCASTKARFILILFPGQFILLVVSRRPAPRLVASHHLPVYPHQSLNTVRFGGWDLPGRSQAASCNLYPRHALGLSIPSEPTAFPRYSTWLSPGSRRERFTSTVWVVLLGNNPKFRKISETGKLATWPLDFLGDVWSPSQDDSRLAGAHEPKLRSSRPHRR